MLKRYLMATLMTSSILSCVLTAPALAADPFGGTACQEGHDCDVWAGTTGQSPSEEPNPATTAVPKNGACLGPDGRTRVACVDASYGWLGSDGCYYKVAVGFEPSNQLEVAEVSPGVAGTWYRRTCLGASVTTGVVWLPDAATGAGTAPPAPAVVAQEAVNKLRLPEPRVGASPSAEVVQLVGVPVWLWVAGGSWGPVSATAAVPGVSVTATARPVSVTWDFGPGGRVVCAGPGTPFRPGVDDPAAGSPDCGITFARSSAGEVDGRFRVTVTVSWSVGWAGAGQTGVFTGLTSQLVTAMAVDESQALVVAPSGGAR